MSARTVSLPVTLDRALVRAVLAQYIAGGCLPSAAMSVLSDALHDAASMLEGRDDGGASWCHRMADIAADRSEQDRAAEDWHFRSDR